MGTPKAKPDSRSFDEKCAALSTAFTKLRIQRSSQPIGIPYELLIPDIGRHLLVMSLGLRRPETLPAKEALRNLVKSTDGIIQALDRLTMTVLNALNYRQAVLIELKTKLRILHAAAKTADVNVRRGAPEKARPREIARVVAQHYYGLTGRKPTVPKKDGKPYGPFLMLLSEVYDILSVDIGASAISQAEEISRNWKAIAAEFPGANYGNK